MNKRIPIILAVAILAASCTEKINLKLDSTYTRLIVDGHIKSDPGTYSINLTKTSDYFANVPSPRLVNAMVSLTDGTTTFPLTETIPGISGVYNTEPAFAGKIGKNYTLNITLPEALAGTTQYSASSELIGVTKLDSIQTVFRPDIGKEGHWLVKLFAQDPPGSKNYYMINLYRNSKLWTDTITKVSVSDNQFFAGNYINGIDVFYINNEHKWETLYVGDTVMMELSAITKEYYDFVQQVQQAGISIPIFSGPPANVIGNVSNNGVGFFSAYSSSFAKTIVK
ncbi:MAG: DUF4249 domain-containing protein [Bacteroidetes bacterium]|nr:DUF4249 domain-containing protein [Bacteroidota bacterium]